MHLALSLSHPAVGWPLRRSISGSAKPLSRNLAAARTEPVAGNGVDQKVVELYDALRPSLYRYLISTGLAPQDVEEVVQESFLRLYRHLRDCGSEDNLRGWIFQVAHNLSANLRKGRRHVMESTPEMWDTWTHSVVDLGVGPEEQVLRRERMVHLEQGIAKLTQLQRECLFLRVEGLPYKEIGELLKISTSTVSSALRNAINKLTKGAS